MSCLRFVAALLFSTLGTSSAFAMPSTTIDLAFPQTETAYPSQAEHIGFTARAPPTTAASVVVTDDVTIIHGGACALEGQKKRLAALGIVIDFVPVAGDIKGFVDCGNSPSLGACAGAVAGLLPLLGDGAKLILKGGDEVMTVTRQGDTVVTKKVDDVPSGATNRTFTKDNAFETIDQFRSRKGGFDELGDSIPIKGDGQGTVAFVDVGGKPIFGVNSSALVRDVDKNLGRSWRDRLGLGQGEGQIVWHAEGHSLMRAYEKTGGNMPSSVNMFVDRISCANCRTHLPKLVNEMGIDNVNLTFKNGRTGRISGGTFEWVD